VQTLRVIYIISAASKYLLPKSGGWPITLRLLRGLYALFILLIKLGPILLPFTLFLFAAIGRYFAGFIFIGQVAYSVYIRRKITAEQIDIVTHAIFFITFSWAVVDY
jgi:hypothetical protein